MTTCIIKAPLVIASLSIASCIYPTKTYNLPILISCVQIYFVIKLIRTTKNSIASVILGLLVLSNLILNVLVVFIPQ